MRLAVAALTAILLLVGTASAQNPGEAGTAANSSATATEATPAPSGITISPKTRKKLLRDLLNAVVPPRPAAATAAPAEPLVPPTGTPGAATVSPAPPAGPATVVPLTPAVTVPRPPPTLQPKESISTPRPSPPITPSPPIEEPSAPPPVAQPASVTAAPAVPAPSVIETSRPIAPPIAAPASETPRPIFVASTVLLLGLLAALAAVAAATVIRVQRARRIEATRAALVAAPRIDLSAGASSIHGLSLVGPPLAIRARLAN